MLFRTFMYRILPNHLKQWATGLLSKYNLMKRPPESNCKKSMCLVSKSTHCKQEYSPSKVHVICDKITPATTGPKQTGAGDTLFLNKEIIKVCSPYSREEETMQNASVKLHFLINLKCKNICYFLKNK